MTGPVTPHPVTAGLAPMRVAGRVERLRGRLEAARVDGLLVTDLANIRYLSGFSGSAARLWVDPARVVLVTDRRYGERAAAELAATGFPGELEVVGSADEAQVTARLTAEAARVGLEAAAISWSEHRCLVEVISGEAVATTGMVEQLRSVKDAAEVARIEAAAVVADEALAATVPMLAEHPTEVEVALALEVAMRRGGADGPAYDPIVASGPNAAVPHHAAGQRRIAAGDLVIVDVGARLDGYRSDMTRTFLVGGGTAEQVALVKLVTAIQAEGVAAVAPGVRAGDVDALCRRRAAEAGRADAYLHATGHGVGLDVHEEPRVRPGCTATLLAGNVVTVEPGIYVTGLGGVRVEDTVLVTDDGCRRLTRSPRQPFLPGGEPDSTARP